jgi:ketosteroid isomerase-like protein
VKRARALGAIALGACAVMALGAEATTPAEQTVMGVTQATCDAFRNHDVAALERLLSKDFTLIGSDASVQPRSQAFDEVRAGDPAYDEFRNHDMTARVYGDVAVVQGITSLAGQSGGHAFALDVRFTDVLVKRDGRWQIVTSHATRIAPARQ